MMNHSLSYETISVFFHDISMMISSGTAMEDSLAVLCGDCADPQLHPLLEKMRAAVENGSSLSAAMEQTGSFPAYALTMIRSAEESGKLEGVSAALGEYYHQRRRTEQLLHDALVQPLILLSLLCVVLVAFLCAVLPSIAQLYRTLGGDEPVYVTGAYVIGGAALALIFAALVLALIVYMLSKSDKGRPRLLRMWVGSRTTGAVALQFARAQFVSDLDVRLSGGSLPDRAFEQSAARVSHPAFRAAAERCAQRLRDGDSLSGVLLEEKLFPPVCTHLLYGALQTGSTEAAFASVRERLFADAEGQTQRLVSRIEPVLTGFFAIAVGLSLLSVMLPLIGTITAMG